MYLTLLGFRLSSSYLAILRAPTRFGGATYTPLLIYLTKAGSSLSQSPESSTPNSIQFEVSASAFYCIAARATVSVKVFHLGTMLAGSFIYEYS
jgi:hypothetical protein